ncbi:alanine and glycine-rich protein-like [Pezoporus wallicus]|uniref:alanine and glycine-rich protein-like n=1 Tax=Pezoporus wallicus TaxID=35540 RepID=UPI002551BC36|nr:alanine and glycine-rich protein-like [Pezoporus wallicus]
MQALAPPAVSLTRALVTLFSRLGPSPHSSVTHKRCKGADAGYGLRPGRWSRGGRWEKREVVLVVLGAGSGSGVGGSGDRGSPEREGPLPPPEAAAAPPGLGCCGTQRHLPGLSRPLAGHHGRGGGGGGGGGGRSRARPAATRVRQGLCGRTRS